MKKALAILLALAMVLSLAACGATEESGNETSTQEEAKTYKVGMVCIGDENSAYDRNFYQAAEAATEELAAQGINVEWLYTYNHADGDVVTTDNEELADEGCIVVFNNSYGQEPYMLKAAKDYPDTLFVGMTNEASWKDDLDNTVNAFPSIYEARYLAGVAAGCKLNELIEDGTITEDEAILGYVGAYTFAEVISGYTAFYLGAKSVCPSVTMKVSFVGSWHDETLENAAAEDLISKGAVVISQHSDSTTPATKAQEKGVYHVGYNISMADVAPEASIVSSRIDWTNYFVYVIKTLVEGGEVSQDYYGYGLKTGDVTLTDLNTSVAAEGTADAIAKAQAAIEAGTLDVFDTDTFTVNGEKVTQCYAIDTDGDYTADSEEAVFDGAFHESYYQSAPYFALRIDGIELINEAY